MWGGEQQLKECSGVEVAVETPDVRFRSVGSKVPSQRRSARDETWKLNVQWLAACMVKGQNESSEAMGKHMQMKNDAPQYSGSLCCSPGQRQAFPL